MTNVTCFSTYENKEYTLELGKEYYYETDVGTRFEEHFVVELKLMKYNDGECYGTECHYGYVFVIKKILKKYYNRAIGDMYKTMPDICAEIKEYKGE